MNHNYYTFEGIDERKVRMEALKGVEKGEESIVHVHKAGQPCNKKCTYYNTTKK